MFIKGIKFVVNIVNLYLRLYVSWDNFFTIEQNTFGTDRSMTTDVFLGTLAALGITKVVLLNSRIVGTGDSRPVTLHMLSAASVVFIVVTTALGEFALPETTSGWWAVATGSLFYAFAIVTLFIAMSILGPIRTSMTMNLEPVSSMVFGFLLLGQALDGLQILGAALVIIAVLPTQRTKGQARAPAKGEPT